MIKILQHTPLLLFALILYNFLAFTPPLQSLVYVEGDFKVLEAYEPKEGQESPPTVSIDEKDYAETNKVSPTAGKTMFSLPLPSKAVWTPTFSDLLLLIAIVLLYFELFKSTHTSNTAIVEHVFSIFVFLVFLIEFIVVEACGTSTFLLMTLLSFIDVAAGITITISTARRDFGVGAHGVMP